MHASADSETTARLDDLSMRVQAAGTLRRAALQRDPDLSDRVMSLVFAIEALPADTCGDDSDDDRALQLIAGQHQAAAR
jgi:hypothetical protein